MLAFTRPAQGAPAKHLLGGKVVPRPIAAEEIYSAIADDDEFACLPARLAEAFAGRSTVIQWRHSDGEAEILAHSGYFSDSQLARYSSEFAQVDPWAEAAARGQVVNRAIDLESLVPSRVYENSRFYNEFIRDIGDDTFRCIGIRVENDHGTGLIAIHRGRTQSTYEPAFVQQLNEVSVHLRRVLTVRGKFAALRHEAKSFREILNCTPQAAMLVDESGALIYANVPAETLLRGGDVIRLRHGRLEQVGGNSGDLFKAIRPAGGSSPAACSVRLEGNRGQQLLATVMPLPGSTARSRCLILIHDPTQRRQGLAKQLQSLYGLTAAEAAVAQRLAHGLSIAEIAQERRVSLTTVRVQLKFLSQKMSCHRQAEVVSLVNNIIPIAA